MKCEILDIKKLSQVAKLFPILILEISLKASGESFRADVGQLQFMRSIISICTLELIAEAITFFIVEIATQITFS